MTETATATITAEEKGNLTIRGGADIKKWRIDKGLSLGQLSSEIGVGKTTLYKAEEDGDLWNQSRKAIADYFGLKVTAIWPELLEEGTDQ